MSTVLTTMVYNDPIFLDIWVRYYSQFFDRKDLHIITHGPGQDYVHEVAEGCTFLEAPRDPLNPRLDQDRFKFISEYASELTKQYDRVIFNDVDEIVVLDPDHPLTLNDYLETLDPVHEVVTPMGLEIVHLKQWENDYDYDRPLFAQRKFVRMNAWYTKPCITSKTIEWGPDGHGCSHDKFHLDPNMYLFHLKWFDDQFHINRHKERLAMRFKDDDGEEVILGAGSWAWSEMAYELATNSFLRARIDPFDEGFDFTRHKNRVIDSFHESPHGGFKINWFVDQDIRILPERFIGVI